MTSITAALAYRISTQICAAWRWIEGYKPIFWTNLIMLQGLMN